MLHMSNLTAIHSYQRKWDAPVEQPQRVTGLPAVGVLILSKREGRFSCESQPSLLQYEFDFIKDFQLVAIA